MGCLLALSVLDGPLGLWNALGYALDHFRERRAGRRPRLSLGWALALIGGVLATVAGMVMMVVYTIHSREPFPLLLSVWFAWLAGVVLGALAAWAASDEPSAEE